MVRTGGYATGISAGSFMEKETGNAMYASSITECVKRLPIMWHYEPIEFDDIVMKICRNLEIDPLELSQENPTFHKLKLV